MMNREIKFRVKRKDLINNNWYYGYLIIEPNGSYWMDYFINGKRFTTEVIPESVGKYTGLKDKNGVERFEDDVIKRNTGYVFVEKEMFFSLGNKMSSSAFGYNYHPEDEVIGNIHENPELLTQ